MSTHLIFSLSLCSFIDFIDKCLKDCLLTNREVVELTNSIIQCCLDFANLMQVSEHQKHIQVHT